jgi:hypothetical protein
MRSFLGRTKEAQGVLPAMGVKCEIDEIERTQTNEKNHLMYMAILRVTEPAQFAGHQLREWYVIGTDDDPKAKRPETWERTEGGPGRLARLLKRAGVPTADDDEEWMDAAAGQEICVHLGTRTDDNGEPRNRILKTFRETDPDFVGIGEALEADGAGRGRGGRQAKAASSGNASARKAKSKDDDDDDEPKPGKGKGKESDDDDTDDEDEAPASKKVRGRKAKARDDDDDTDED